MRRKSSQCEPRFNPDVIVHSSGNNAAIVLSDVDIKSTCTQLSGCLWFNAGQVCIAPRRLYIPKEIFDQFVSELAAVSSTATEAWTAAIGPIQNKPQFERIMQSLADAESSGANFILGGKAACQKDALYAHPAIITNLPHESPLVQNETFGTAFGRRI